MQTYDRGWGFWYLESDLDLTHCLITYSSGQTLPTPKILCPVISMSMILEACSGSMRANSITNNSKVADCLW